MGICSQPEHAHRREEFATVHLYICALNITRLHAGAISLCHGPRKRPLSERASAGVIHSYNNVKERAYAMAAAPRTQWTVPRETAS